MPLRRTSILIFHLLSTPMIAMAEPAPACRLEPLSGEFAPLGVDVRTVSKSIVPGDDFFRFVNAGWIASTPIPAGYWDYGQTNVLISKVDRQIADLLSDLATTDAPRGSVEQQVRDANASFLDTAAIELRGARQLRKQIAWIMAARTADAIARRMADPTSSSLFAINVYPAELRSRVHLDQQNLVQPMLGLPSADDYRRTDADGAALRDAYVTYVAQVLDLAGIQDAHSRSQRLLALETRIAANLWPFEKLRDRRANYHPLTVAALDEYAPGFPWRAFLAERGVAHVRDIVLGTDTAVQAQAGLFAATPLEDWRTYLSFHWIQNQIDVLPEDFRRASWEFYGRRLSNAQQSPPRQEVAARLVSSALGQQLGKLYAQRYVKAETRAAASEMIVYLRKAFEERLAQAGWMDDSTRVAAQAKLARLSFKVGYPMVWRDFSGIRIDGEDAAGNLRRLRAADWLDQRRRLEPGVKEVWNQTPQTVDASYSVLYNAVELPGAFLQPPYFDAHADPAVNFGAIGAIVGHEIGHGFDDQGIIYDAEGRMRDWWSKESLARFHQRAEALVSQYDAYAPYPDAHVNGRRTIGENISDLSGVLLAYRAYHLYLSDHPCPRSAAPDGLSGDQRFFMSWAQAWRYQAPESAVRHVVKWGFHAPTPYRVNGVMRNIDEWYEAFGVKPGDALYLPPEQRVKIW
jgi:putative endopeptidase